MAIPATAAFRGTPAFSRDRVEAQTEPIDVEPLEPRASDTWRMAYGNSSRDGRTGTRARSARAPWPISRRLGEPTRPVSPVEYGGKVLFWGVGLVFSPPGVGWGRALG